MSKKKPLSIIDRETKKPFLEMVWGQWWLHFLYGETFFSKLLGTPLLHTLFRWPLLSWAIGKYYDSRLSKRHIAPFCRHFDINMTECELPIEEFHSFNDFFTRHLRSETRPQAEGADIITIPADGRYTFIPTVGTSQPFRIKGEPLCLENLLGSHTLAARFLGGSAVIARLCPTDCHRFYFCTDGQPSKATWIRGSLFSVNPIATKKRPQIWWKNRRAITLIETEKAGTIAYVEVGATNCGSIIQNFVPDSWVRKGDEKGFFRIGGSAIILFFEPNRMQFSEDLVKLSSSHKEIYCKIGQPLGKILNP